MDYNRAAATSKRLLERFGNYRPITIRKSSIGAYNPLTGTASSTTTDTVKYGVVLPFGKGQTLERGNAILVNDSRLLLEPSSVFTVTDKLIIDGVMWGIVSPTEINPAGTPVLYDLHIRK